MIAVLALCLQVGFNITQTLPPAQLCKYHGNKLCPAAGLAQPLALVTQRSDRFKFMSANYFKQLQEDCITMRHGLDFFVFQRVVEKLIVNQQRIFRPFLAVLWDSSGSDPIDPWCASASSALGAYATSLNEQRLVDRFMRYTHRFPSEECRLSHPAICSGDQSAPSSFVTKRFSSSSWESNADLGRPLEKSFLGMICSV